VVSLTATAPARAPSIAGPFGTLQSFFSNQLLGDPLQWLAVLQQDAVDAPVYFVQDAPRFVVDDLGVRSL